MSKLICDICGTSYPDTATQCPICGCVRPAESAAVSNSERESQGYTYVKGGRFSKANVKKRNNSAGRPAAGAKTGKKRSNQSDSNKVLVLVIVFVLLFLLVACMVGFIISMKYGNNAGGGDTNQSNVAEIPCTGVTLSKSEISFTAIGEELKLNSIYSPINTTDEIEFSSSDETVATVSQDGTVVCVGAGEAVIYVYCGEQKDECLVKCVLEEETEPPTEEDTEPVVSVSLTRQNITDANFPGYRWGLYEPGDIPAAQLTWVSDDAAVATVDSEGFMTAVGEGQTVIRVFYNGVEVATCSVTCDFSQQEEMPEDEAGNYVPYSIYGPIPFEQDKECYTMTMALNEWVGLFLRDPENPDERVKVQWTIVEGDCRIDSDGAGVTATSERNCKIKAEYNGQTFYILIY